MSARRVWLTGASEGIGRATGLAFASEGARLAICARRPEPLRQAAEAMAEAGASQVEAITADVATPEGVQRFVAAAEAGLGGADVLVHNAGGGGPGGVLGPEAGEFEADWSYAFGVNLMAAARLARGCARHLEASGGVIVHVSSAWSLQVMEITAPSYGATKAGLNHLTVTLARELGPRGVRVVGVAPGPVWTETWERQLHDEAARGGRDLASLRQEIRAETGGDTALGRPGQPVEVARAIRWLASPEASFITGTTLAVDGGYVRSPR